MNRTEIIFVLDKSGSMSPLRKDVLGSFNEFLKEQQAMDGQCSMTLILFNQEYHTVFEAKDIQEVKPLDHGDYLPSGMTALIDAVGMAVDTAGERFSKMDEDKRPTNVVLAIFTDGQENSSQEYNKLQVKEKIEHQTEQYKWKVIYMGQGIDSFHEAASIGVRHSSPGCFVSNVGAGGQGFGKAVDAYSYAIGSTRSSHDGVMDKEGTQSVLDEEQK